MRRIKIIPVIIFLIPVIFIGILFINIKIDQNNESIAKSYADKLIVFVGNNFDIEKANEVKERISRIEPDLLKKMYLANIRIKLINGPITLDSEIADLKGEKDKYGASYENVAGAFNWHNIFIRFDNNYSAGVELHEIGHAIDYLNSSRGSSSSEFLKIYKSEANYHIFSDDYFISFPEEYFAQCFYMYCIGYDTRKELKRKAPMTYKFIKKLIGAQVVK